VLAVGPGGRYQDGKHIESTSPRGEIGFSKYCGTEIKLGIEDVLILRESDVLAKVVNTGGKRKRKLAGAPA
jgi:chaperonin GroES